MDEFFDRYETYIYDDSENLTEYIGDDYDKALEAFERLKSIHSQTPIKQDITIILYDNLEDKVIKEYNTLNDA